MRTAGSKFDISEANVHCWRNYWSPTISFKATTRKIQIVEAILFVAEIHAEGLPVTHQAMQLKAGKITKSPRTKHWEAGLTVTQDCL